METLKEDCQTLFSNRNDKAGDFWKILDEQIPDCKCEQVSVSSLSPCPIKPSEELVSIIPHEKYVNLSTNKVKTNIADRLQNGLSVDRIRYTNKSNLEKNAQDITSRDTNMSFLGVFTFSTSKLGNICRDNHRCYAVYDTALSDNISHAEVIQTNYPNEENLTKNEKKEIRRDIRKLITGALGHDGKMVSLEEIFNK